MILSELMQELHTLNISEQFYKTYQEKKRSPRQFQQFLNTLDKNFMTEHGLIIPEIPSTIPPSMYESYSYVHSDSGIMVQKHNCYTPPFPHKHTFFEAFYVYEGSCEHDVEGEHQTMNMGDFCIIPPGVEHTISVQDQSIIIVLILNRTSLENVFSNPVYHRKNILSDFFLQNIYIKDANHYLIFHTGNDEDMRSILLDMMLEGKNKYAEYEAVLYSLFGVFFARLIRHYANTCEYPKFSDRSSSVAYGIITYIQENYRDITLKRVAEKFHYTPEYTSKFIKETSGKTFSELLTQIRMEHAEKLLKNTALSIGDISYDIGYENPETFIRNFKKVYKKTPAVYRRESSIKI